ncbi:MAG TPA: hypothetical protein VGH89_08245 [Pseudonocardia sp.]
MSTAVRNGRIVTGANPFAVRPEGDRLQTPRLDIPHWGETMYFHVWNPEQGVGIWIHTGRCPEKLDLWWAQTVALLPGGRLLMDRSWGYPGDDSGPATENLRIRNEEPLTNWTLHYDGAGEATTTEAAAAGPVGAGPCLPFQFEVTLAALTPVWDMDAALGIGDDLGWAHMHHEQALSATGTLTTTDGRYRLDGVSFRDHSCGPRDFTNLGGDQFFNAVSPSGRVAHGLINWKQDDKVDHRTFAICENGRYELFPRGEMSGIADRVRHEPRDITVTVGGGDQGATTLRGRWLHGFTVSLLEPNVNINGAASFHPDPLILTEGIIEWTWPDGEVGWGKFERDYRLRMIPSPDPR